MQKIYNVVISLSNDLSNDDLASDSSSGDESVVAGVNDTNSVILQNV